MPDIHHFLEDLSSGDAVPGGGSVAGLQVAMSASLLAMVSRLTLGRKRYDDVQQQVGAVLERALTLRDRAEVLAQEDVLAYAAVSRAMALPRATDDEKRVRTDLLQQALKGAADPPLETMRVAAECIGLAVDLVRIGNRSAISDVGTSALAARAGFHAARLNVEINLASVRDEQWVHDMQEVLSTVSRPDDAEREVMAAVEAAIRGDTA